MNNQLVAVKPGLFLAMLTLVFGISMGIGFGTAEDSFKSYIEQGVAANPSVHDSKSVSKIWRYAQRGHFHATGIAAFTIALISVLALSTMKKSLKKIASILIGLGGFYPLSWFTMFLLSPSLGRSAAHHHIITELFTYVGVAGLLSGIALLCSNLFLGMFEEA